MIEKEITVSNQLGIHARPASLIVQTASRFKASLSIVKDGVPADAKSIMSVMMLAAAFNSKVILRSDGPDEKDALAAIEEVFAKKFNEE